MVSEAQGLDHVGVMQRNRERRVAEVTDEVLFTADEVAGFGTNHFDASSITRLAASYESLLVPTSGQEGFNRRLETRPMFESVMSILKHKNIVLCGGSVASCFSEFGMPRGSDYDFFVVGVDANDEKALWSVAQHFVGALSKVVNEHTVFSLSHGLLSVECEVKMQLILRAYPSISSVIHAFDINACSMAFDGVTTFLTEAAAFALWTSTILVDPALRSTTYEKRLIKYAQRKYALGFPNLQLSPDMKDDIVSLPYFDLFVCGICGLNAVGGIELREDQGSDYEVSETVGGNRGLLSDYMLRKNIWAVNRGDLSHCVFMAHVDDFKKFFDKVVAEGRCVLGDILDKDAVVDLLARAMDDCKFLNIHNVSKHKTLERVFGMTKDDVLKLVTRLVLDGGHLNIGIVLDHLCSCVMRKLRESDGHQLGFWIVVDPGRQWTASRNPAVASAEEYYGEYYVEAPEPVSNPVLEGVEQHCPICYGTVYEVDLNCYNMPCGHAAHLLRTKDCDGSLEGWIHPKGTCPHCRADLRRYLLTPTHKVVNVTLAELGLD